MKSAFIYLILLISEWSCQLPEAQTPKTAATFETGKSTGSVQDTRIAEASGMVASTTHQNNFWVINDSGNSPELFLITHDAKVKKSYKIHGTINFDWEDITMLHHKTGGNQIVIGDIGDNFAIRDFISLIVLQEPAADNNDSIIYGARTYHFRYPDGNRDAETLISDPLSGDMFIISKREPNVRLYKVPSFSTDTQDTLQLQFISTLPFFNVTAGDISQTGTAILLKNYDNIYFWSRDSTQSIPKVLKSSYIKLPYVPEPQGESIAWDIDQKGFYTLSEKNPTKEQNMYYHKKITKPQ